MIQSILLMAFVFFSGGPDRFQQDEAQRREDAKLSAILDAISKTTPEGNEIIEKVQNLKPEVNGIESGRILIEIVNDFSTNKGAYNIRPIGWEASQKKSNGRWRIIFHYRTYSGEFHFAEWEYNQRTGHLYPFNSFAAQYWTPKPRQKVRSRF